MLRPIPSAGWRGPDLFVLKAWRIRKAGPEVSRSSRSVVEILLLGSILTGCMLDGKKNEPRISNESGVAVEILWTGPTGDEVHYANIAAGDVKGVFEWVSTCTPYDMVAKTADGRELARTEKPLCPGDFWVIPSLGSPSPSLPPPL